MYFPLGFPQAGPLVGQWLLPHQRLQPPSGSLVHIALSLHVSEAAPFLLVSSCCCNKNTIDLGLEQQTFLTVLEAGSPRSRY